jgi:capsular exopolysaccharide synthesis family protein
VSRIFEALRRSEEANAQVKTFPAQKSAIPRNEKPAPAQKSAGPLQVLPNTVETGWADFGSVEHIQCHPRPEDHLVALKGGSGAAQERFRVLCHRIQQIRQQRQLRHLLVTSAIPKEGKTVVAINLASLLARSFPRVLLVDADMRNPGISRALGLPLLPGLAEFLDGKFDLRSAVRQVDPAGFYYVSSGRAVTNPVELLQKPALQEFVESVASAFDWVIFDSPPLNLFADAQRLSQVCDAALLVFREGVTPREAPEQCMTALDGRFVAGIVLNASNDPGENYYADYRGLKLPRGSADLNLRKPDLAN